MVDGHQLICSRNAHSLLQTPKHSFIRIWMGSSSGTDECILSWSLVGRPIPSPYLYVGNNGHLFHTDKSLKIYKICVMISTDNTGGTHSPNVCLEVWKILQWCLKHHIVIRICHVPGKFNVLADRLSRINKIVKTEWALDQSIANSIFQMFSFPSLDLGPVVQS